VELKHWAVLASRRVCMHSFCSRLDYCNLLSDE